MYSQLTLISKINYQWNALANAPNHPAKKNIASVTLISSNAPECAPAANARINDTD